MPFIGLSKPLEQPLDEQPDLGELVPDEPWIEQDLPGLVVFLRHTGCPFAESAVKSLSSIAENQPLRCVVICHGDTNVAEKWFSQFELSDKLAIIYDESRSVYGRWGVGYSAISSLLNPAMLVNLVKLALKGIRNRDASGTRWQTQMAFLWNKERRLVWKHKPAHAGDLPNWTLALSLLG